MEYKGYKIETDLSSPCATGYIYYPISEGINNSKHAVSIEEAKEKIDEIAI